MIKRPAFRPFVAVCVNGKTRTPMLCIPFDNSFMELLTLVQNAQTRRVKEFDLEVNHDNGQ